MCDKELLRSSLQKIEIAVGRILERSQTILSPDDFLNTPSGVERMESICMLLIAIGESVKRIDKETNKQLLSKLLRDRLKRCNGDERYYCSPLF